MRFFFSFAQNKKKVFLQNQNSVNEGQVETSTSLISPPPNSGKLKLKDTLAGVTSLILKFQASQLKQSLEEKMLI